jgi:hypothetical protein
MTLPRLPQPQRFLESDLFAAFARLGKRLRLKSGSAGLTNPRVENTVVPITSMDDLLKKWELFYTEHTIGGASQTDTIATVPTGKRWEIFALRFYRESGDRTIDTWGIVEPGVAEGSQTWNNTLVLDTFTASNNYRSGMLNQPLALPEGAGVTFSTTAAGSTNGTYHIQILLLEEDAF